MTTIESTQEKDLEVKTTGTLPGGGDANNLASPDLSYIGSKVDAEDVYPSGMRQRGPELPLRSKIGYHELEDEPEDADEEWMMGEASTLSGAGSRGSSNWVLKILLPLLLITGVVCMHHWWTEVKDGVLATLDAVGDIGDRRTLMEDGFIVQGHGEKRHLASNNAVEDRSDKTTGTFVNPVYSTKLEEN